jgi:HSP20 family protein
VFHKKTPGGFLGSILLLTTRGAPDPAFNSQGVIVMADTPAKTPAKSGKTEVQASSGDWRPFESLHREIDRLFDDFRPFDFNWPSARRLGRMVGERNWALAPAMDLVEHDKEYEITAELPGIDEKNVEIKLVGGTITIKGEKREAHEEKEKDYHLSERRYGSFRRTFAIPEGVDAEKIDAKFEKGVLTVKLPKSEAARKSEKKIPIQAG